MHDDNGYDKNGNKINDNGGDEIDYLYDDLGNIVDSKLVATSQSTTSEMEFRMYGIRVKAASGALYDPSWDIFGTFMPVSKLVSGFKALMAARSGRISVVFGKTSNQIYHTFRHTDALGLDRKLVQSTIKSHLKPLSSQIIPGKPFNQIIQIGGHKIQYTAFKLSNGKFNIGRIHGVN